MKPTLTVAIVNPPAIRPCFSFSGPPMQVAMKYRRIFGRAENAVHESGNVIAKLEGITLDEIAELCPVYSQTTCYRRENMEGMVRDIESRGHYVHDIIYPKRRQNSPNIPLPYIIWSKYPPQKPLTRPLRQCSGAQ